VLLALAGFVYGFFQFGMYASFGAYFTELFPTELRGAGQAFAYNFGRAGSAVFVSLVPIVALAAAMDLSAAMLLLGIGGIAFVVLATLLLPETAGSELRDLANEGPAASSAAALPPTA
jgi:amino acid permease